MCVTGSVREASGCCHVRAHLPSPSLTRQQELHVGTRWLNSASTNAGDELLLLSGGESVSILDFETGATVLSCESWHRSLVNCPRFSHHHPALLATASLDEQAALWDVRVGMSKPAWSRELDWGAVLVQWSPQDDRLLVCGCDNRVLQLASADGRLHSELDLDPIDDALNYTKAYYTPDGSYIASVSRLEDELRLSCAATGDLVGAYKVRDGRPLDSLHCLTRTCRPDPFHPYRFALLVDGWMVSEDDADFDSALAYAVELPLSQPLQIA